MAFRWRFAPLMILLVEGAFAAPRPVDLKDLDSKALAPFEDKASNTVTVTLDGALLKVGAGFLFSNGDEDSAKIKKLLSGLKSVTVRSFEFKTKGQYSRAQVDAIRKQLKTAEWSSIVSTNDKEAGETSEVYMLGVKDKPGGLLIIVEEPLELTFVQILGAVNLEDLASFDLDLPDFNKKGNK